MGRVEPNLGPRRYVDIIMRVTASGVENPMFIIMDDGRTFEVDRVTERKRIQGGMRFSIMIGNYCTCLWKDTTGWNGPRWYVRLRNSGSAIFVEAPDAYIP